MQKSAPKVITNFPPGAEERKAMIRTGIIGSNVIRITAPDKLERADFEHLAPVADDFIKKFGTLRLLIDATSLKGWKNVAALQHHAAFVKSHQRKVDCIAVILAHERAVVACCCCESISASRSAGVQRK